MILPGISGGYLLLLLGTYVPILGGIDAVKHALSNRDLTALWEPLLHVVIPVGLGVGLGVLLVSNLIKIVLEKFTQPTLGTLMGLLLGAVVGLWPFQQGVEPKIGDIFKGRVVDASLLTEIDPSKYPTENFDPNSTQMIASIALILVGFAITWGIAKWGGDERSA
ncbi:MAG: DUF368 domain-containing protein [Polyangiales bacterium]